MARASGEASSGRSSARGAAYADFDGDGDLDVLVTTNGGPARLLRNDGGNRNPWLRVKLGGTTSNRDGIGAQVTVTLPDGRSIWRVVQDGLELLLAERAAADLRPRRRRQGARVEVAWPSGKLDTLGSQAANRTVTLTGGLSGGR